MGGRGEGQPEGSIGDRARMALSPSLGSSDLILRPQGVGVELGCLE